MPTGGRRLDLSSLYLAVSRNEQNLGGKRSERAAFFFSSDKNLEAAWKTDDDRVTNTGGGFFFFRVELRYREAAGLGIVWIVGSEIFSTKFLKDESCTRST